MVNVTPRYAKLRSNDRQVSLASFLLQCKLDTPFLTLCFDVTVAPSTVGPALSRSRVLLGDWVGEH